MLFRMRVLVVDDSVPVRARLVEMIRELGDVDAIDEASDAHAGLASARMDRPDVVVLDIHLPGTSGIAILPRLKALPLSPLVVVLTNDAGEGHRRQCLLAGADFFFDKAKEFEKVIEVIAGPATERSAGAVRAGRR
jgi:two-component system response regulator DevR